MRYYGFTCEGLPLGRQRLTESPRLHPGAKVNVESTERAIEGGGP